MASDTPISSISTSEDFIRIINENPEIRAQVRRALLTDELIEMPEKFAELVGFVGTLVEAQRLLIKRLELMEERLVILDGRLDRMESRLARMETHLGMLRGAELARKAHRTLPQRLSREYGLRRAVALRSEGYISPHAERFESEVYDAEDAGLISESDVHRLLETGLVIRAVRRDSGAEVYIAVEASGVIGDRDIARALESASALARVYQADSIAVVAGYNIEGTEQDRADALSVRTYILQEDAGWF